MAGPNLNRRMSKIVHLSAASKMIRWSREMLYKMYMKREIQDPRVSLKIE